MESLRADRSLSKNWDLIVVPGCRVDDEGRPGRALRARLQQALLCFHAELAGKICLTGAGQGPVSEAVSSANWLLEQGLHREHLILEEDARNTRENALFVAELAEAQRIIVVTQDFHARRCRRNFAVHFEEVCVLIMRPCDRTLNVIMIRQ